ncbi:MAG: type II toxin-antitoxin system HipA family toxin [Nocardioides sp.]|uniref:type II toxin-antitoxin system HipA family toxin n=1 Tax=Nocardioides sp. TaxID=35761 RepID=UPI003F0CFC4C
MADSLAVWLEGHRAGVLTRDREGNLAFTYDEGYRTRRGATPLSLSMPKHRAEHRGDVVRFWFDNLLPDDDDVRQRWATDLELPSPSPFNLLSAMGVDCAGAVQVLPIDADPDLLGTHEPVDDREIERRLASLRRDVTSWNADEHGGRWSLAGAQGKFALSRRPDGSWAAPTGRAASTHIFKVGVVRFANADIAEYVSMRAAKHLGLDVAPVEIMQFGEQTALVVGRYDRVPTNDGVRRFHQEDICQATGRSREAKYQGDGGPGVRQISELISHLHPLSARPSRELFGRAIVYNWLTAGPDAHAKNYSLLLAGDQARLAPLYDLTSGPLLLPPERVFYKAKAAMKIGGEYRFRGIGRSNLTRFADELRVEDDWILQVAQEYRAALPEAFERAIDEAIGAAASLIPPGTKDRYMQGIGHLLEHMSRHAGLTSSTASQKSSMPPSPGATRNGVDTPVDAASATDPFDL